MTQFMGNDRYGDDGDLQERVVKIRRVAKVVKGGRHLTFNAMVVVGDGKGRVGVGLGKGAAVPDAVRKGTTIAKKNMAEYPLKDGTVPHAVIASFGAAQVLMKPARPGSGIKAGGAMRAVMEAVGVKDVVAKALGSRNPINVVKATIVGLQKLQGATDETPPQGAILPAAPERRGPMRREGGGGFRGQGNRDRDRRPPPRDGGGPPRDAGRPPRPPVGGPAAVAQPPAAAPAAATPAAEAPAPEAVEEAPAAAEASAEPDAAPGGDAPVDVKEEKNG